MPEDANHAAESPIEVFVFRCCDAGVKHCDWVGSADTEDRLLIQIEQHARDRHNLIVEGEGKEKIRSAMRKRTSAVGGI
jgi:predicted small metal-binding protein